MNKKYKLIPEEGTELFRIRALRDFGSVKAGDLGGFIESEKNLSHYGNCWVFWDARVCGNAKISGDAMVDGNARVFGDAEVSEKASISEKANVSENAWVYDNAKVYGNAHVYGNARVYGNAKIYEDAHVYGDALLTANAVVAESHYIIGPLSSDITEGKNVPEAVYAQTGIKPEGDKVILFKSVKKTEKENVFSSLHDPNFLYKVGDLSEVPDASENPKLSCGPGLHVSHYTYWDHKCKEAHLKCEVQLEDILAVQQGKIRCRTLKVIESC
jgi:carbonic anhydrase/acetyltransferase-like protein (isoleucine patch superfamily)